jgi:hypothetical protein
MKILVIGFQRSGTTLLRRLMNIHPDVKRMFHEVFLLNSFHSVELLSKHLKKHNINIEKDNWGEKVPYYPSARKIPIIKYCENWENYFGINSRILHIVRHPYDVALSNVKKFQKIKVVGQPIDIYKKIVPKAVEQIGTMKSVYTFKYEDLLIDPDRMMFNIYKHCNLNPDIDFRNLMLKMENIRYQKFDPSRAFAYKEKQLDWDYDLDSTIEKLNEIDGVKYELQR